MKKARQEMRAVTPMTMRRREARRQDFFQMWGSARVQGRRTPNHRLGPGCQKSMSSPRPQQSPETRICEYGRNYRLL